MRALDLSDNELGDEGVAALCLGLRANSHLRQLALDRCFRGGKPSEKRVRVARRCFVVSIDGAMCSDAPPSTPSSRWCARDGATASRRTDASLAQLASACPLESLSLRGGKGAALQADLVDLLYELGNNAVLKSLDVSAHASGDAGDGGGARSTPLV